MDKSSSQIFNKETLALNNTIRMMKLIDIYETLNQKTAELTFFSSAHGTFSRIDHMLGNNTSLSKFKKTEIISSIFSNHSTETRNYLPEKKKKRHRKHKHVEAKQYSTKQIGH